MTTFGVTLARMRTVRRLSQGELGRRAGINHSAISRLEDGTRPNPLRGTVTALANALDATDGERFDLLASAGYLPDDCRQFLARWYRMPLAMRRQVTELVIVMTEGEAA